MKEWNMKTKKQKIMSEDLKGTNVYAPIVPN